MQANMYKDEATLDAVTISAVNDWYLINLAAIVDAGYLNANGITIDANGEFINNSGGAIRIRAHCSFVISQAGGGDKTYEMALAINNGAGYATNGSDIYDIKQRWIHEAVTGTQLPFPQAQTALIADGEKFGMMIRNTTDAEDPTFRYWSFRIEVV